MKSRSPRTLVRPPGGFARTAAAAVFLTASAQAQSAAFSTPFVISKVQLVYSVVSHRNSISDRINFYNTQGNPAGNDQYAVPMLVCDPLVTLYNPGNQSAAKQKVRVQISDPPAGFKFKKNSNYLRTDFSAPNGFLPMARFQIAGESNASARKIFRMCISELGTSGTPGAPVQFGPGESRTYAPWVEENWNWALETAGGYNPRSFYDWNAGNEFTTVDGRTHNPFGVESVSGWDPRAGFQMDQLSHSSARPAATLYAFETQYASTSGWVSIKNSDTFSVEAIPMRAVSQAGIPDFQVDLLGGNIMVPSSDLLRAFPMSLGTLSSAPGISRIFSVGDLLQNAADVTPGGKAPFAVITMIAKTEALQENRFYEKPPLPTADLYEVHFTSLTDFNQSDSVSSSDRLAAGFQIHEVSRSGDQLFLDFATGPEIESLRIVGTASLAEGFTEDLSAQTISVPGPPGSGLHKAIVNIAGKGPKYFIRLEELPTP